MPDGAMRQAGHLVIRSKSGVNDHPTRAASTAHTERRRGCGETCILGAPLEIPISRCAEWASENKRTSDVDGIINVQPPSIKTRRPLVFAECAAWGKAVLTKTAKDSAANSKRAKAALSCRKIHLRMPHSCCLA